MSTLKVTKLQHPDAASAAVELESDGSIGGFLGDELASKLPYSFGTATPTTTDSGFLWYDSNDTPPAPKFWDGAAFQALTSGKILQVVRATDSTDRSTSSTTFVDVTGMSVTITPQKSDSAILIFCTFQTNALNTSSGAVSSFFRITDNSNNAISGAEGTEAGISSNSLGSVRLIPPVTLLAYSTPATTDATTYKLRFRLSAGANSVTIENTKSTGQIYAIEVSA